MSVWRTAKAIAETSGADLRDVDGALRITGLNRTSVVHARGVGVEREYSPEAQALVLREVKGRGKLPRG